jgi:hypothetical protein
VHTNKWLKVLDAPLVNYSNGAKPAEDPNAKKKPAVYASSANDKGKKDSSESKEDSSDAGTKAKKPASGGSKPQSKGTPESSTPKDWPFKDNGAPQK